MKRNKKYLCVDTNEWFPRRYLSLEVWRYKLYRLFTKSIMIMDFCWKWRQLIHLFCLNNRIQVDHARNEQKVRCKFTAGVKSWSHCANIVCSPTGPSIALFISESFIFLHWGISSPFAICYFTTCEENEGKEHKTFSMWGHPSRHFVTLYKDELTTVIHKLKSTN